MPETIEYERLFLSKTRLMTLSITRWLGGKLTPAPIKVDATSTEVPAEAATASAFEVVITIASTGNDGGAVDMGSSLLPGEQPAVRKIKPEKTNESNLL